MRTFAHIPSRSPAGATFVRPAPRLPRWVAIAAFLFAFVITSLPSDVFARRSGGSFSGRGGFRSGGGSFRSAPRSAPSRGPGGTNVVVVPGGGFGFSPFGYGLGYGLGGGSWLMMGMLGVGALVAFRAVRMSRMRRIEEVGADGRQLTGAQRRALPAAGGGYDDDDEVGYTPDRTYVYRVQLGLGRSARALQQRLEQFAAEGDTASETGLAQLLNQTALELLREKESIRYGSAEGAGPLNMANGEAKLNGWALAERSRYQVERVRGAEGKVRRSEAPQASSGEVLEYLLITVVVATRSPVPALTKLGELSDLDVVLRELGGIPAGALLGLEVIWIPADPDDALTESEMLTSYPDLRSL